MKVKPLWFIYTNECTAFISVGLEILVIISFHARLNLWATAFSGLAKTESLFANTVCCAILDSQHVGHNTEMKKTKKKTMSPQAEIKTCNKTTRGLYCVCSWLRQHRFFLSTRPCNCHSLVPALQAQSTNTFLLPGVLPCLCAASEKANTENTVISSLNCFINTFHNWCKTW